MIRGLGIDVVEVSRIAKAMARNPKFVERILTPAERRENLSPSFVAGRWAAKEAVAKAVSERLRWHDVEIYNDSRGMPHVHLVPHPHSDESVEIFPLLLDKADEVSAHIRISISHERGIAAAVALWEDE